MLSESKPSEHMPYDKKFLDVRGKQIAYVDEGEPCDVVALVESYGAFMQKSEVPKLFINADPDSILTGAQRDYCRGWLGNI